MRSVLAALVLLALPAVAEAARFAVIAGNDVGDVGRPKLWYAQKDADRFRRALGELGDFAPGSTVLLVGKRPRDLVDAIQGLDGRIQRAKAAGERTLLVVYYSGHAGGGGLEMGTEKLPFPELRALVSSSAADAKIAIVDACESGLLTQVKGAAAAPALEFPLPSEDAVQGTAFIASTAVGESAQESAALGGSFFTHHLEIALRGAADLDGDGRVTLTEAFAYTSSRTAAQTSATLAGVQHATYEFKMSGRGDVVLSDLRKAESRLVFPPDGAAQFFLKGPYNIFAEVPGSPTETILALPAGHYRIERRAPEGRATAELDLERGRTSALPRLVPTRYEMARAKGGPKPALLYLGAGASALGLSGSRVAPMARAAFRQELGPIGARLRIDYGITQVKDQALAYDYTGFAAAFAALYPLNVGRVLIEGGPEVGYGYVTQRLTTLNRRAYAAGVLTGGLAVMVTAPVGPLRIGLDATAGVQAFKLNDERTVKPAGSLAVIALYGF